MDYSLKGSCGHFDSPGKNTGLGFHAFLLGIFPTLVSNPGLPHCRRILHRLSHQGMLVDYNCAFSTVTLIDYRTGTKRERLVLQ